MNEARSAIITSAVTLWKSDGDTSDIVVLSEVDSPPWSRRVIPGARPWIHVTVNSGSRRCSVCTDV